LEKLAQTGLFTVQKQTILVDKESRKYFESQLEKFEEDFVPDMDFLQTLLKKVPIHVLPIWYAIPKTSNNIFESLIEKHLLTPQIFQRYLIDVGFDPILKCIIEEVHSAKDLQVPLEDLMQKLCLSREVFDEYILYLEFHFVCCLQYQKTEDGWKEFITPFHEWRTYLEFLQKTETPKIRQQDLIQTDYPEEDASLLSDLITLLSAAQKQPLHVKKGADGFFCLNQPLSLDYSSTDQKSYIHNLIVKASILQFIDLSQDRIQIEEIAEKWLGLSLEEKSLYLYRHPKNRTLPRVLLEEICTEKSIREVEKSLLRVLDKGWVFFDDFIKGAHVPLQDAQTVKLQKTGKKWSYTLPEYSEQEKDFFRVVILCWLAESGSVQTGFLEGKECFRITNLGQKLFAR
jgi:hypothetical protein